MEQEKVSEIIDVAVRSAVKAIQERGSNINPKVFGTERQRVVSSAATPFGCCNFFDRCADGIMSLHYSGGLDLLDYFGFQVSDDCRKSMDYITYVRPSWSGGHETAGHIADACADPNGIEYGATNLYTEDFGRYGRLGPVRDMMKPKRYCKTDPLWRLDGVQVTSEIEWDMKFIIDTILLDIMRDTIVGSFATPGQFDGLEQIVATGYASGMLDSNVINWNGNPMAGGAGITWNGVAQPVGFNFIDYLYAVWQRNRQRISWNQRLKVQQTNIGDTILVLPNSSINCLLDHFTCWSVCEGGEYTPVNIALYESRTFRQTLNGGMFGNGRIFLDGIEIPILGYDHELIKGPQTVDIYMLQGYVGNWKIWDADHISATAAASQYGDNGYSASDGGRILWNTVTENECSTLRGWMHPRLFCRAPWLQTRFQSVQCRQPGGFLSPDPAESSFFPETSFSQAECP